MSDISKAVREDGRITVQELIDHLMKIEDKSIPVHIGCENEFITWALNNLDENVKIEDEVNYDIGVIKNNQEKTGNKILMIK